MEKEYDLIQDYVTGEMIPDTGAEANRQATEKFLIEEKGYDRTDIAIDVPISFEVVDETYRSYIDIVVSVDGNPVIIVKCAAGSLGSRERETIAAARILGDYPVPRSVVSDGKTAIVLDTLSGRTLGLGMQSIPSRQDAVSLAGNLPMDKFSFEKVEKERLIFRSYDSMNVNRPR